MKKGFTLAEVLVTLGIIGVVSALTLPTLIRNHQRQVLVTQLQKSYSLIAQGIDRMMTDSNAVFIGETKLFRGINGDSNEYLDYLKKYFQTVNSYNGDEKVSHEYMQCTYDENTKEYHSCTLDGSATYSGYILELNNGAVLNFANLNVINYLTIRVDINGAEPPNILGRDYFIFLVFRNSQGELIPTSDHPAPDTNYIIEKGWKMDY